MDNERQRKARERTLRVSRKKIQQQKAIAGEHSIEAQGTFLANIYKELKKVGGIELDGYDLDGLYRDCDEGHLSRCRSAIINGFREWMREEETDDTQKVKIHQLSDKAKRWLKENVLGWSEFYQKARQIKAPLPNDIKHYLKHLLGYRAVPTISQIEIYQPNFENHQPTSQQAFQLIFEPEPILEDDYKLKRIRKKLLRELKEQLVLAPIWLDQEFEEKTGGWPTAWMRRDKRIMDNLNQKGNRRFFELVSFLFQSGSYMRSPVSEQLASERGWESNLVLLIPDYRKIEAKLSISKQIARKYLQEMARWGMIQKLGKTDKNGQAVYAIGRWVKGGSAFPKPVFYLKDTKEMRDALRAFNVYWQEKSQK